MNPLDRYPPCDGGVNVRKPGREEEMDPRFALLNPRFAPLLLKPRLVPPLPVNPRDSLPRAEDGGVNVRKPCREDVTDRPLELNPPRAATLLRPTFVRDVEKKCCELDGAFR